MGDVGVRKFLRSDWRYTVILTCREEAFLLDSEGEGGGITTGLNWDNFLIIVIEDNFLEKNWKFMASGVSFPKVRRVEEFSGYCDGILQFGMDFVFFKTKGVIQRN